MRPRDRIATANESESAAAEKPAAAPPSITAIPDGGAWSAGQVLGLQQAAGNQAVAAMASQGKGHGAGCGCTTCG